MPNVEDPVMDNDDVVDAPTPVTFGERHEHRDAREDIEYEHQMHEAMRKSLEDCGPQQGYNGYYGCEHGTYGPQGG